MPHGFFGSNEITEGSNIPDSVLLITAILLTHPSRSFSCTVGKIANELIDPRRPENIICIIMKYGKTF